MLTGIVIGLSISQVIGILLGAITSLLSVYFGLKREENNTSISTPNYFLIAAFSITCFFFILIGIFMRTHNLLSPSIKQQLLNWTDAGYSIREAKIIVALREGGILLDSTKPIEIAKASDARFNSFATLLMASHGKDQIICKTYKNLNDLKTAFQNSDTTLQAVLNKICKDNPDTAIQKMKLLEFCDIYCNIFNAE